MRALLDGACGFKGAMIGLSNRVSGDSTVMVLLARSGSVGSVEVVGCLSVEVEAELGADEMRSCGIVVERIC